MARNTEEIHSGFQVLTSVLLRDAERIAERSAARMQELLPSYARVPREKLVLVVLAYTRNLLQAIGDQNGNRRDERSASPPAGQSRAGPGITCDEMLHAWRIGQEVVREEAHAVAGELGLGTDALLEFVEATQRWGDVGLRATASAQHKAEIRELGRLAGQQAALRRVATLVAQGALSDRLFAIVAEQVAQVLHVPLVSIARYEPDGTATERASRSDHGELWPVGTRWSLEETDVLGVVRTTGRPARIDDYTTLEGMIADTVRRAGIRSAVGVPILVGGELWGAIVVFSEEAGGLPADTEARLVDFCELVAMAISNANARSEVERLAQEHAALRRVATLVAQESPPEEVLAKVAEEVGLLLRADAAVIWQYEPDGETIVVGSWGELADAYAVGRRSTLDGDNVASMVHRSERRVRFDDYEGATGSIAADARTLGVRAAVGCPIIVNGRLWGAMVAATFRSEPVPPDAESRIGEFTELLGTAISNIQARAEVQRLVEEQAALRRVATMVARESPPEEVFAEVAKEVGRLLRVETAAVHRYDPDGHATVVGSWGDVGEAFRRGSREKLDCDSVTAKVFRTRRPSRVDSYEHVSGSIALDARKLGLRSAAGTPIIVNGRLWGMMGIATARPEPLPPDAETRIAEFTDLMATAIANVQARADLAASRARIVAAADEERRGVVRDLHDGAQQQLVHTIVTLKLARRALERNRRDATALVEEALHQAQTATDEVRELAHGILPTVLSHGGLRAGAAVLASRMSIPVGVDVSVDRLPEAVEATAYFLIAEALTNIAKHARARHATVHAHLDDEALRVEVRDDGVGGAKPGGSGLVGLSDRLAVLDATLRIESPAGGGTVVRASIPLHASTVTADR